MKVDSVLEYKGNQVVSMPPEASVSDAAKLMQQLEIGSVLVCEGSHKLCGLLAERDIVHGIAKHGEQILGLPIRSLMHREVEVCRPGDLLNDIMEIMTERRIRHLPVRDQRGEICGMISIGDVVKARIDEIEREARELRDYIAMA